VNLTEIKKLLNMEPLPFKWLDEARAIFASGDTVLGIVAELLTIELSGSSYSVANVSFGIIHDTFENPEDLDLTLTGKGLARTIFSTVGAACLANTAVTGSDIICLGASDKVKERRDILYSMALTELQPKLKKFDRANNIRAITDNGTFINILSAVKFSAEDQELIADKLGIIKA